MLLQKKIYLLVTLLIGFLVTACSNSKHLSGGESLYKANKVHVTDRFADKKTRKALETDLSAVVRPRANSKFLGIRLKLSLYNAAGDTKKKKGIRKWVRSKVGEPPVLASNFHLNTNKDLMLNVLQNRGFFYATVSAAFKKGKNNKSTAEFNVVTGPQYFINKVIFIRDSTEISRDIDSSFSLTLLKEGVPYNLDLIKAERERIDHSLKEMGYFYFRPDYILVVADSSIGNHKVNLYVKLKDSGIPDEAYNVYVINNIFIYANYKLHGNLDDTSKANKVLSNGYNVIDPEKVFRPDVFSDVMVFEKGDDYNLDDQNTSLSRLVNMGVFKFVKNRFDPTYDSMMDVYYYLTPYPKKAIRFEVGLLTQNDNRAGTQGSISWRNRNAFKGAEELLFKINGGIEAQITGVAKVPDIYTFGAETDLSFPRFEVPFFKVRTFSHNLPRSILKLKYSYESESGLLRINSYTASYGYDWKEGLHIEHQFYPINFTYVKTDTLGNTDRLKLLYSNLIFNGIILGPTYEFTYNSQAGMPRRNSFYFDGLVDLAGNILGIAEKADYKSNPQKLLGVNYAQYIKLQPDFRYQLRFNSATTFASRILAGVGIPYGNSFQLPNIKQFWAGGNSDLRGFASRLLGPGTFNARGNNKYIETLGDLKLECNLELRQNLYKFINGAIFMDAGNIWLYHDNPDLPGGAFTSGFYNQLAADVGIGLRFDFKILILRFDLGMPVRDPWLTENNGFVINKINFADRTWRSNNLVFNIAIGYPF